MRKGLVIGGTGTMGQYLCPMLAKKGYEVHAIAGEIKNDRPGIRYFFANALDNAVLESFLKNGYDAVVDFMWYDAEQYKSRYELFLRHTDHYFAISSYRLYDRSVDNSKVLRATGLCQEDLMPIRKGLQLSAGGTIPNFCHTMDQFLGGLDG